MVVLVLALLCMICFTKAGQLVLMKCSQMLMLFLAAFGPFIWMGFILYLMNKK